MHPPTRRPLISLLLSGLVFTGLMFTLRSSSWVMIPVLCVYALSIVNQLDQRLRWWLSLSDTPIPLTKEGIKIMNEQAGLHIKLIHDDDLEPKLIELGRNALREGSLKGLALNLINDPIINAEDEGSLSSPLSQLGQGEVFLIEDYLEVRTLPLLPLISGRQQLGLFATRPIPIGAHFIWRSDYAVVYGNLDQLPVSEKINRRPLAKFSSQTSETTLIQSGGDLLRSNPITLANFSWCHTESVSASESSYRILPPNDLGKPNCHFKTIAMNSGPQATQGRPTSGLSPSLHSALVTFRALNSGDQLLIFSGEGKNLISVSARRLISSLLDLMTPALIIAPWLLLYVVYTTK